MSRDRVSDRASPRRSTYAKLGPRSLMGRFGAALQALVDTAKDGHDTSRQQKALLERLRRMLRAERRGAS